MKKTLIVTYSLFIIFLVGSAIFAARTFDGDVDNAYEKGMQYPVNLEKIAELGWHFSVINHKINSGIPGEIELLIFDNDGTPVKGAKVSMELSLLTKPDNLPSLTASENSPGHYSATVDLPVHGYWQIDTTISHQGETVLHRFKIYIEKEK
jgi:hypothetical protein